MLWCDVCVCVCVTQSDKLKDKIGLVVMLLGNAESFLPNKQIIYKLLFLD